MIHRLAGKAEFGPAEPEITSVTTLTLVEHSEAIALRFVNVFRMGFPYADPGANQFAEELQAMTEWRQWSELQERFPLTLTLSQSRIAAEALEESGRSLERPRSAADPAYKARDLVDAYPQPSRSAQWLLSRLLGVEVEADGQIYDGIRDLGTDTQAIPIDDFVPITFRATYGNRTIKGIRIPTELTPEEKEFLGEDRPRAVEQAQSESLPTVAAIELNPQELK